jgi:hypothetical protein
VCIRHSLCSSLKRLRTHPLILLLTFPHQHAAPSISLTTLSHTCLAIEAGIFHNNSIVIHRRSSRNPNAVEPKTLFLKIDPEQVDGRQSSAAGAPLPPPAAVEAGGGSSGKQKPVSCADLPLKFLLDDGTRKKYTFDSPTRTWNGNLWGMQKKDGGPDMAFWSNFCAHLRPNLGDSYKIQRNQDTIVWNGVRWILQGEPKFLRFVLLPVDKVRCL